MTFHSQIHSSRLKNCTSSKDGAIRLESFFGFLSKTVAVSWWVLLFGFGVYAEEPKVSDDGALANRYREIEATYQNKLKAFLKRPGRSPAAGLKLKQERDDQLKPLFECAGETLSSMSLDDVYSVAMIAESLELDDECHRFARYCVEVHPGDERAYFPLVRHLLNADRFEEAERVVEAGVEACGEDSRVGSLNGPLFMYARHRKMYSAAHSHVAKALVHFTNRSLDDPMDARLIGVVVDNYRNLVRTSGQGRHEFDETRARCFDVVVERLSKMNAHPQTHDEIGQHLAQLRIACQLAPSRDLIVRLHCDLIAAAANYITTSTEAGTQEMVTSTLRYVGESSMHWKAEKSLARALDSAISHVEEAKISNDAGEKNLQLLRKVKLIFGSQAKWAQSGEKKWSSPEIDWLTSPTPEEKKCVVVCFWRPLSLQSANLFQLMYRLAGDQRIEVRFVAKYSGFATSPKSPFPIHVDGIDKKVELENLAKALPQPIPVDLHVGLFDDETATIPSVFPTILLLDQQGTIVDSVWGVGKLQQSYLVSRIDELTNAN